MTEQTKDKISTLNDQIYELQQELRQLEKDRDESPVENYTFLDITNKQVTLTEMFGEREDLIVIHNMGKSCSYCTMWADGFIGLLPHLESRTSFVVTTPDDPEVIAEFAKGRNWPFKMFSVRDNSFKKDMGYENKNGGPLPGVSVFHKYDDGRIVRTGTAVFGPGDPFCATWPLFGLLKGGVGNWEAKFAY